MALFWYGFKSYLAMARVNLLICFHLGVMTSLLQEIISVYPLLNPSQLTAAASNRVCNALALLQCVASHQETRQLFLSGKYIFADSGTLSYFVDSSHPAFPIPLPQHNLEVQAIRIPAPHLPWCHRRPRQKRLKRCDQLSPHD